MDPIKNDPRFVHVFKDPRFKKVPKHERKIKIDKRFKGMFEDKDFKLKYTMDKRGRPMNHTSNEDIKKFYDLPSTDSDTDENEEEETEITEKTKKKINDLEIRNEPSTSKLDETDEESEPESSDGDSGDESDELDLARGEGNVESSSDSETSSSDTEDENDEELIHGWGELDTDAPDATHITNRLAVCNMDWDRIKANDIYVLLNSFKPAEGLIKNIKIYPSEYGKSRLKEEDLTGPQELVEKKLDEGEDEEDVEGSNFHMEKLRKYQLNRLRYYYAVVECDSPTTANKIYEECNGIEYESSAVRLDLRFIPDSMTFDDEPVSVSETMPEPDKYKPSLFTTTALQQAKVELTWDETDPERVRATQKAFEQKDFDKLDLKQYLASSGDENSDDDDEGREDNTEKDSVSKYRALLNSIEEAEKKKKEKDVEMEISWTPGLKETTKEIIDKKQESEKELTPWEQYQKKKEEKRKKKKEAKNPNNKEEDEGYSDDEVPDDVLDDDFFKQSLGSEFEKNSKSKKGKKLNKRRSPSPETLEKKAELELLLMDEEDGKKHFNLKSLLKTSSQKGETVEPDNFQIDVNDERFSELYSSHLYHIDPSDQHFKKTKGMERLIEEKQRRLRENKPEPEIKKIKIDQQMQSVNTELKSLVKSVKSKSHIFGKKKKWK